jgi:AcrR family transcriptional regulator
MPALPDSAQATAPQPAQDSVGEPRVEGREAPPPRRRSPGAMPRVRRSQEARSAETRARLLDATLESLIEAGYAGTTTTRVCERAGLSRGAQVHHFPKKQDLVVSAVAHLATRQAAELRDRAAVLEAAGRAPEERVGALVDLVAEAFGGRLFVAALELWVGARTDPELHRSLYAFERAAGRGLAQLWREIAGDLAANDRFDAVLELTMHLARGMALQKILRPDDTARLRLLDLWREMVTRTLRADDGSGA